MRGVSRDTSVTQFSVNECRPGSPHCGTTHYKMMWQLQIRLLQLVWCRSSTSMFGEPDDIRK